MVNPTINSPLVFAGEVSPASVGMRETGVRRIYETFERFLAEGLHPGAQLVVLRYGQVVLDCAAGSANIARRTSVTPDTPFMTYSVTKPFTGMCIHHLIEEGKVELDAPIARYWPEWGCKGKEKATIRHAFLHQAGIPLRGLNIEALIAWNWNLVSRYVARLKAEYEPGTVCAYHLVNYGFILGEVVRRVTGKRIDLYMQEVLFEPLGLKNSFLGLPRGELKRAAHIYCGDPSQRMAVNAFNWPSFRGAVVPAATLNSTAREVATFYQMLLNGGIYAGRRIVQPETITAATQLGFDGRNAYGDWPVRWAYGFGLGGNAPDTVDSPNGMGKGSTLRTFGHFGQASCMAWADPDVEIVVAFTCNRLLGNSEAHDRWRTLSDAVWDAIEGS